MIHAANLTALTGASESRSSSSPSNSSQESLVVEYADEVKQTLQKKDYRPVSTLHRKTFAERTLAEHLVARALMPESYHELKPASLDRGPLPVRKSWEDHLWILPRAMAVPLIQQASYWAFPNFLWPVYMAYPLYFFGLSHFLILSIRHFQVYAEKWGTLDEKNIGRDRIPDVSIPQLAKGVLGFLIARTFGEFYLKWDQTQMPLSNFSLTTPVRMFAFLIVMDYFFYAYHRSCHEIPFLWRIHQHHHTTRHPSPILAIMADEFQEIIEVALCPLAATLLVPMNFHELFVLMCYTAHVEVLGHTGIRAHWGPPITGPVLALFGLDATIEDHDLHHRYGKSGRNFGKQSILWDHIFGTTTPREETAL